ncbi:hypothetical protein DFH09DRAFT_379967 [Mycena vulgaris]|nr:hypothetical protein DFH09DRAFT_379967 [Mycena vulgaris]
MAPSFSFTIPETPTPPASLAHLIESNVPLRVGSMESTLTLSYIDELESQVALIDEARASLKLRREALMQSVKTHKALLSPMRRLPPEILGEIFSLVVHATFHFGDISEVLPPVTRHAPWLFTRICRYWSAVALSTPALWSMIFMHLDRVGERGAVPLAKLCLQRSANVPLTLKIFEEAGHESHPVLDAILSSSERWQKAEISMASPLLRQIIAIRGRLSALTTVLVTIDLAADVDTIDQEFWDVFAVAPKLTSLYALFWDVRGFCCASFSLPWHQLTRLSTTFTSNTEALSTLRKLSKIVECTFAFTKNEILPRDTSIVHLPHLRILVLQIETEHEDLVDQHHTSLLDFLKAPRLESLTIHYTANEEAVLGLLTRSDCAASLTSFRFYLRSIDYSMVLHLVQQMPHLSRLEIGDFNETLLQRSSLPAFLHLFSKQWLEAARETDTLDRSLSVLIVDHEFSHDISLELAAMHKDGLFIEISSRSSWESIILQPFNY